jgi:hypothetical protein
VNTATEQAIRLAMRIRRSNRPARELLAEGWPPSVALAGCDNRDAAELYGHALALAHWARRGCPLITFKSIDDAVALAETEPPTWTVQNPFMTAIGFELGDGFLLVKPEWPGPAPLDAPEDVRANWEAGREAMIFGLGPRPFDKPQLERLIVNALLALSERPEGLDVVERRPSKKAARKRGRRYFPDVEYIIGSKSPLWKAAPNAAPATGEPEEGWTLSVRTIVRGHWRKQACGPGMADRKVIWIRPHWRGPEDAPISVHETELAAA